MPKETTDKELKGKKKNTTNKKTSKSDTMKTSNVTKKKGSSNTIKSKKTEPIKEKAVASKTSKSSKANVIAKETNTVKKTTTKDPKKDEIKKVEIKKDEKVKEQTIIEKIKAFIAKIVAMQEEARLEEENNKEEVDNKKDAKKEEKKTSYILEYYDLPYRYNETVVKILAQTPKRLFVYWDISDDDRQKYLKAFGESFFEETYPVLLVHNQNLNYTFEVPINDFANSWYLDINDSKAKYTIQLGRKFRQKPTMVNIVSSTETESVVLNNDYVPIITSNMLEVPNDHILFENIQSKVVYRNVKNGEESTVEIDNLEFAKKMGHIYSIYDIYKEIYKQELDDESLTSLLNPSSMSSSVFR